MQYAGLFAYLYFVAGEEVMVVGGEGLLHKPLATTEGTIANRSKAGKKRFLIEVTEAEYAKYGVC